MAQYKVVTYEGAELVEVKGPKEEDLRAAPRKRGKRGEVKGYSKNSQRRMKRAIAKIHKRHQPLFVTVTYEKDRELTKDQTKRHLDNFMKRMAYDYPTTCAIWKIELTAAGQYHYHMLVYGIRLMSKLTAVGREHNQNIFRWVRETWNQVSEATVEIEKTVTQVEPIQNKRKTGAYLAKYMAKNDRDEIFGVELGRAWGIYNRKNYWKMVHPVEVSVSRKQWEQAKRVILSYAQRMRYGEAIKWIVFGFLSSSVSMSLPIQELHRIQQVIT